MVNNYTSKLKMRQTKIQKVQSFKKFRRKNLSRVEENHFICIYIAAAYEESLPT